VAIGAALRGDAIAWVEAENRGDSAYRGHRRGVVQVHGHYLLVYDALGSGAPPAAASFGLQFASGTRLEHGDAPGLMVARNEDATLRVATSDNLVFDTIASGQESPPLGWISPRYGELQPAPMLRHKPGGNTGPFATILSAEAAAASVASIEGLAPRSGVHAFRVTTDRFVDYVLASTSVGEEEVVAWDIRFVGKLLWLRTVEGRPRELRWLAARRAAWQAHGLDVRASEPVDELLVRVSPTGSLIEGGSSNQLSAMWFGETIA